MITIPADVCHQLNFQAEATKGVQIASLPPLAKAMIELLRMTDHELAERCKQGDRIAQQQVYRQFSGRMYAVCCRYVGGKDDAEDVLVSAFMKVFTGIAQFRHEGSFEGWIRRIVVNEALGFLRANRRFMLHTALDHAGSELVADSLSDTLGTEELLGLISELPEGYRTVFNLYVIDGYAHSEIADQLGITENTSKSQLSKARRHLQMRIMELEKLSEKRSITDGRSV